ncbi:N-acetylhexosamine 1-kinase [termite gut metagenome]|uniref:N-acetylhexosamine 1-kinase n=1 Tax=termite gut metagenome TaxID=433724 RepID=A0A5J4T1K0_9ZZZZ
MMKERLLHIANQFQLKGEVKNVRPLGEGLINDTYFIETSGNMPNYILQRKNGNIFKNIPAMMDNIYKVTSHLKKKIEIAEGDPLREAMTLVFSKNDTFCYIDEQGEYWTACLFIEDTVTHQYASSLELAYQGGKGIGKFQAMLADMNEPLTDILPGFHNIKYRFQQWDECLQNNKTNRIKDLSIEIGWIEKYREEMLDFWQKIEAGIIPIRVTHNDTKISNILFDKSNDVLCVIDLDTVLNSTCLNDYGDAIRSYTNAGLEDDRDINNVYVKMDVFESYTKGYLSEALSFLTQAEIDYLVFSAKYISFEQVLRFLMDYIDGDTYYKTNYDNHNLIRTHAQYKLLQSIEDNYNQMTKIVTGIISKQKE